MNFSKTDNWLTFRFSKCEAYSIRDALIDSRSNLSPTGKFVLANLSEIPKGEYEISLKGDGVREFLSDIGNILSN